MNYLKIFLAIVCLPVVIASAAELPDPILVESQRIWDDAPHNAFTDLIRFEERWYCVFREGPGHIGADGALRIITSEDGEKWESAALISSPTSDLRDAKISVTPNGKLMLAGTEAIPHPETGKTYKHQSIVWFSDDGKNWSKRYDVADPDFWLWRITWHKGKAYGFSYGTRHDNRMLRLYSSNDGKTFKTLVENAAPGAGYANETSMVFLPDGTCYCLLRRGGKPNSGLLGTSQPPYTEWIWKDLGVRIGGPEMFQLPDGRFIAAVRLYDDIQRTSLCWVDPKEGTLTECLKLPSGGDNSYPGLVWHDGLLWVSYYSSHEGKTSIYLAKVRIDGNS